MKPRLAISACLLGQRVRFDGDHRHNVYITETLGLFFDFVPFCPEVAIGLGVPRPPIRLVERDGEIAARGADEPDRDFTFRLRQYAEQVADGCDGICGYILQQDSPSCGMEQVKVYTEQDRPPVRKGRGIYADRLMQLLPHLPCEEESRLMDPDLRENFIGRVFTSLRWQQMLAEGLTPARLVDFHSRHKFLILAHHEPSYRRLGRILATTGTGEVEAVAANYVVLLMAALKHQTTPRTQANVLLHIMDFFKERLDLREKSELLKAIEDHRNGLVPAEVPIALINYFRGKHPNSEIDDQVYLEPHPLELMLRTASLTR